MNPDLGTRDLILTRCEAGATQKAVAAELNLTISSFQHLLGILFGSERWSDLRHSLGMSRWRK
jgi:hypothetical protein